MTELICLIVFGISGIFCYDMPTDYNPPGTCINNICYVVPTDLQARASWYDPALYNPETGEGRINCVDPCDLLGNGAPVIEYYDKIVGCPFEYYNKLIQFGDGVGVYPCWDTGNAAIPTCREVFVPESGREFHCFITFDFLRQEEAWFTYLLFDWDFLEYERKISPWEFALTYNLYPDKIKPI